MSYPTHGPEYHERLGWTAPCRAATTANITIATALNAADVLDGVTLAAGDRVLVKDQTTGSQNGIYVVSAAPARAGDYSTSGAIVGSVVLVSEGTTNADTAWQCTTNAPITVGTTALVFAAFGGGGAGGGSGGRPGYYGDDGEEGPSGPPGPPGMDGVAGGAGPAGPAGPMGLLIGDDGDEGPPGAPGPVGPPGIDGATGPAGLMGLIYGEDGDEGPMGPPGSGGAGGGSALTVEEADGSPTNAAITKIVVPNDSLSIAGSVATLRQVPYGFIGCRAVLGTLTSIANTTFVSIAMSGEDWDTDGFHSTVTNNSRMTIPAGLGGKYLVVAQMSWDSNTSGERILEIVVNGSAGGGANGWSRDNISNANGMTRSLSCIINLAAGDYVELKGYQSSGGTRNNAGPGFLEITKLDAGRVGSGIGARVVRSTSLSLTDNTDTAITLSDSETFDTDGFHDLVTNSSRMTIPAGLAGKYLVTGSVQFAASATGNRGVTIRKNGTTTGEGMRWASGATNTMLGTATAIVDLAATDYVEVWGYQSSGGALNATAAYFSIMRLDAVGGMTATDSIWDASGDLAVGTGADTAAKLAKGAAGTVPTAGASTLAYAYPPGYEFDYVAKTSDTSITATTEGTADTCITGGSITYDGSTTVVIEAFSPNVRPDTGAAGRNIRIAILEDATVVGHAVVQTNASGTFATPVTLRVRRTPASGAKVMYIKAWVSAGTGTFGGGAGGSDTSYVAAFLRITKV